MQCTSTHEMHFVLRQMWLPWCQPPTLQGSSLTDLKSADSSTPSLSQKTKMAANHDEDSVSNKSHSAHNWHLHHALIQAINVSLVSGCLPRNPPHDRLLLAKIAEAAETPWFSSPHSECDARLSRYCNPMFCHNLFSLCWFYCKKWNFEISGTCWCATTPRSLKEKSGTVKLEDFVCQIEVGKTKIVKDK